MRRWRGPGVSLLDPLPQALPPPYASQQHEGVPQPSAAYPLLPEVRAGGAGLLSLEEQQEQQEREHGWRRHTAASSLATSARRHTADSALLLPPPSSASYSSRHHPQPPNARHQSAAGSHHSLRPAQQQHPPPPRRSTTASASAPGTAAPPPPPPQHHHPAAAARRGAPSSSSAAPNPQDHLPEFNQPITTGARQAGAKAGGVVRVTHGVPAPPGPRPPASLRQYGAGSPEPSPRHALPAHADPALDASQPLLFAPLLPRPASPSLAPAAAAPPGPPLLSSYLPGAAPGLASHQAQLQQDTASDPGALTWAQAATQAHQQLHQAALLQHHHQHPQPISIPQSPPSVPPLVPPHQGSYLPYLHTLLAPEACPSQPLRQDPPAHPATTIAAAAPAHQQPPVQIPTGTWAQPASSAASAAPAPAPPTLLPPHAFQPVGPYLQTGTHLPEACFDDRFRDCGDAPSAPLLPAQTAEGQLHQQHPAAAEGSALASPRPRPPWRSPSGRKEPRNLQHPQQQHPQQQQQRSPARARSPAAAAASSPTKAAAAENRHLAAAARRGELGRPALTAMHRARLAHLQQQRAPGAGSPPPPAAAATAGAGRVLPVRVAPPSSSLRPAVRLAAPVGASSQRPLKATAAAPSDPATAQALLAAMSRPTRAGGALEQRAAQLQRAVETLAQGLHEAVEAAAPRRRVLTTTTTAAATAATAAAGSSSSPRRAAAAAGAGDAVLLDFGGGGGAQPSPRRAASPPPSRPPLHTLSSAQAGAGGKAAPAATPSEEEPPPQSAPPPPPPPPPRGGELWAHPDPAVRHAARHTPPLPRATGGGGGADQEEGEEGVVGGGDQHQQEGAKAFPPEVPVIARTLPTADGVLRQAAQRLGPSVYYKGGAGGTRWGTSSSSSFKGKLMHVSSRLHHETVATRAKRVRGPQHLPGGLPNLTALQDPPGPGPLLAPLSTYVQPTTGQSVPGPAGVRALLQAGAPAGLPAYLASLQQQRRGGEEAAAPLAAFGAVYGHDAGAQRGGVGGGEGEEEEAQVEVRAALAGVRGTGNLRGVQHVSGASAAAAAAAGAHLVRFERPGAEQQRQGDLGNAQVVGAATVPPLTVTVRLPEPVRFSLTTSGP